MSSATRRWVLSGCMALAVVFAPACTGLHDGTPATIDAASDGATPPMTPTQPDDASTTGACQDDKQCERSPSAPFCDPWRLRCSQCLIDRDCAAGQACIQRRCAIETRCDSSLDCTLGAVCDGARARCVECTRDADCEADFRCDSTTHACRARCVSDLDCTRARMLCDRSAGLCVASSTDALDGGADAAPMDAAPATDASTDAASQADAGPMCKSVALELVRLIPSVMLLVDGSGSMQELFSPSSAGFADVSRWQALRAALVGTGQGIVPARQGTVRFGLVVFGSVPSCPTPYGIVSPALDNAAAVGAQLDLAGTGNSDTPTGPALALVSDRLPDPTVSAVGPQIIVLATEGEPNSCTGDGGDPLTAAIAAARAAQAKHQKLYVVSVGNPIVPDYLQQLANLGAGLAIDASPGAQLHVPTDPAALTSTLGAIVDAERGCDFEISGARIAAGGECMGSVTLDGAALACNGADGWSLPDPMHIRLHGTACTALRSPTAVLAADFPCDAVIL